MLTFVHGTGNGPPRLPAAPGRSGTGASSPRWRGGAAYRLGGGELDATREIGPGRHEDGVEGARLPLARQVLHPVIERHLHPEPDEPFHLGRQHLAREAGRWGCRSAAGRPVPSRHLGLRFLGRAGRDDRRPRGHSVLRNPRGPCGCSPGRGRQLPALCYGEVAEKRSTPWIETASSSWARLQPDSQTR